MEKGKEQQLATKKDLVDLRQANKKDLLELKQASRRDLIGLQQTNKKDLIELRQATKKDLENVRVELKNDILFLHTKFLQHDERMDRMEGKLDKTVNLVQQMCDKVMKGYQNFTVESVAIKDNYQRLEARVTKVESVVFPNG